MKQRLSALLVSCPFFAAGAGWSSAAVAGPVLGQGTWQTTLQPRDLNVDGTVDAFYDVQLNITWLRDANVRGPMNWASASQWASSLVFGSLSDWRLPTMVDTMVGDCFWSYSGGSDCGYNVPTKSGPIVYSELAHLYYDTLGNKAACDPVKSTPTKCSIQPGFGLTNSGDFLNLRAHDRYWTGLQYEQHATHAWTFWNDAGSQSGDEKSHLFYAMAVRDGDVRSVPEPSTQALAAIGLLAAVCLRRRSVAALRSRPERG